MTEGQSRVARTLNIHVDMDNLWIYELEYGLTLSKAYDQIYEQALPRMLDVFERHGIKATFFAIGKELEVPICRQFCAHAASLGHEFANHTYSHPVNLHRLTSREKEAEIRKCEDLITAVTNKKPRGFRAPGYYLDDEILQLLIERDYLYDSTVLPGYATQLMRLAMYLRGFSGLEKAFGRNRYLFASRQLLRIELPKYPDRFIYELPIATAPWLRMPIHPTFIYQFGVGYFRLARRLPEVYPPPQIYLFHAIDLLDYPHGMTIGNKVLALGWSYQKRLDLMHIILNSFGAYTAVTSEHLLDSLKGTDIPKSWLLSGLMKRAR